MNDQLADLANRAAVPQQLVDMAHRLRTFGNMVPKEVGIDVPDKAEIKAMLDVVTPRWRPLVVTAVFTGLRASELRGLTWGDVDLDQPLIRLRQRADRWNQLGPPKSSAGWRDVPIAPMVLNTLREWKLACRRTELDLVFPSPSGNVLDHAALYWRAFAPYRSRAGSSTAPASGSTGRTASAISQPRG